MLAEELGYSADDRLVILNADDFGMCDSTNRAIAALLHDGIIDSTSLMTACPWMKSAAETARLHPEFDVGIHLTLTSEWKNYKWGPVSAWDPDDIRLDDLGYYSAETPAIAHANPNWVWSECRAQVEAALKLGVDLTHMDNHMTVLHGPVGISRGEAIMIELAAEYGLPLRLPRHPLEFIPHEESFIRMADKLGVVLPDYLAVLPFFLQEGEGYETVKRQAADTLRGLKPGVTELIFHPSRATDELKAITGTWAIRQMEYDVFRDPDLQELLRTENIRRIRWRDLREVQRSRKA